MIIYTNIKTDELIAEIEKINDFQIKYENEDKIFDVTCDVLLIDGLNISLSEVACNKEKDIKCIYIVRDENTYLHDFDDDFLNLNNLTLIHNMDDEIKLDLIIDKLSRNKNSNNIFGFFGADANVGNSLVASLVAKNIANRSKNKTVCYLSLSGQEGLDWFSVKDYTSSLNDLKISLKNEMLSISELRRMAFMLTPNLYLLKGEPNMVESQLYHQKEIYRLIDLLSKNFDILILDLGNVSNLTLRMTYAGLVKADNKILITNQLKKSIYKYNKAKEQVLKYFDMKDFKFLIVNNYIGGAFQKKSKKLEEIYKLPMIAKLPHMDYNLQVQYDGDTEMYFQDKEFEKGLIDVVSWIEKKQHILVEKKKKTFKDIISRRA